MNKMDEVLTNFGIDLDGRFSTVRTQESNLGNLICDAAMSALNADCCLINSGTFRSDRIHPTGKFTYRDLMAILPFLDPMVLLLCTGEQLICALENGVSQYPKLEGRFPQLAGIQYAFDPKEPPGKRVHKQLVVINNEPLDLKKEYRLTTKAYLADGKDGYDILAKCKVVVDVENAAMLTNIVQNYFSSVEFLCGMKKQRTHHHQNLLSRRSSDVRRMSMDISQSLGGLGLGGRRSRMVRQRSIQDMETERVGRIAKPKVEGRIRIIESEEQLRILLAHFGTYNVAHPGVPDLIREESEDVAES